MSLRDIGNWFSDLSRSIGDGFSVASTQSFWDWPLWISVPVVLFAIWVLLLGLSGCFDEMRTGEPESLGMTILFGVVTFLCVLATYDLYISMTVFEEGEAYVVWLRIAYPIMTTFFGTFFAISIAKRRRK
jgi:hypothetical protein